MTGDGQGAAGGVISDEGACSLLSVLRFGAIIEAVMPERLFIGRQEPILPQTVRILRERFVRDSVWDMSRVLALLPGRQAARRLGRIIETVAAREGLAQVRLPLAVTPSELPEQLYAPALPLATPTQSHFAWMRAAGRLPKNALRVLAPRAAEADGPMVWGGIAEEAARLHAEAAAECLTLADIARACGDDPRWQALARLEQAYSAVLADAGLADRNDARALALDAGAVSCDWDIYLIATVDLNGIERALLRGLTSPVCAVVPAPPDEQDAFDDVGCLHVDHWHDREIPIGENILYFVPGPAEQVGLLADLVGGLGGDFARDEITVGVGDEAGAESLGLALAAAGLPAFSPFGRPLGRVSLAALLGAVRDFLRESSARMFAALVRHPDLERWLTADGDEACLLDALDLYRADHLPESLAEIPRLPPILANALARVNALLEPLRAADQPLSEWAEPIADLLSETYSAQPLASHSPQTRRAFEALAAILKDVKALPPTLAPRVSGPEALAHVLAQAENIRLPSDAIGEGVEMMGWLELALDDAPVLLLTGFNEGCVPAGGGDDSLLPDSLRRRLGLSDNRRRQARDGLLLRVMLESRPRVHLIVPRRGADGAPRMPSRLLFACDGVTAARRALRYANGDSTALSPRPLFPAGDERRLPPPRPEAPANEICRLKATGFRDYLACPYRFYLQHVLGLRDRDDAADEMDARLFGILIHECLAAFARSHVAVLTDSARVGDWLREELGRQSRRLFGGQISPALRLQVRQAGKRLDAFSVWQAESVREGWQIQPDLSERDLEGLLTVDGRPFVVSGRPDRVDYCAAEDRWRIIDYKTGDAGRDPDEKHRGTAASVEETRPWTDLQLPLYRLMLEAQGLRLEGLEVGYVLLAADLAPISFGSGGGRRGGTGFVAAPWSTADYDGALACADDVVRKLRRAEFWPPAAPPRFADAFSGLCLDACRDRADWLGDSVMEDA